MNSNVGLTTKSNGSANLLLGTLTVLRLKSELFLLIELTPLKPLNRLPCMDPSKDVFALAGLLFFFSVIMLSCSLLSGDLILQSYYSSDVLGVMISAKFCCLIVKLLTLLMYLSQDCDLLSCENSLTFTLGTNTSRLYKRSKRSKTKSLNFKARSLYLTIRKCYGA